MLKQMKTALALLLAVLMMTIAGLSVAAAEPDITGSIEAAIGYTKDNFKSDFDPDTGYNTADMWSLLCALSAGKLADPEYAFLIPEYSQEDISALSNVTDYSKTIISLLLTGNDPYDYCGTDLVKALSDAAKASYADKDWQVSANVIPYTIIALKLADENCDVSAHISQLAALKKPDGGYSWDAASQTGDVDTTGPVIVAFSADGSGEQYISAAAQFIKSTEDENGYFVSPGGSTWEGVFYPNVANANTQAMGIIGLAAADQMPSDVQLNALMSLQTDEGGFVYNTYAEAPDYYSTHQAIIALKCVDLLNSQEPDNNTSSETYSSDSSTDISNDTSVSSTDDASVNSLSSGNSAASVNQNGGKTATTSPKTGDNSLTRVLIIVAIAVVAVVAIVVCTVIPAVKKKKDGDAEASETENTDSADMDNAENKETEESSDDSTEE